MTQLTEEKQQRLSNHMARLGAGLLILKEKAQAPIRRPMSYPDRVTFEFEGETYAIVSASLLDSDSQAAGADREAERVAMEGIKEGLRQRDLRTATRMRDKCAERIRAMRDIAQPSDYEATIWNRVITSLSSLTLDPLEPEKQ